VCLTAMHTHTHACTPPKPLPLPSPPPHTHQVLIRARPTVSPSDLGKYVKFTEEFGEEAS